MMVYIDGASRRRMAFLASMILLNDRHNQGVLSNHKEKIVA